MPYLCSPERYADSVATIRSEADAHQRDLTGFGWFAYVFVSLDDDAARAREHALAFFGATYRADYDAFLDRVACVGDVATVTERLSAYVAAGAEHLILVPLGPEPMATAGRLLDEVRPAVVDV
jgi:alkanesulfonate monooxygenase SsuD/methylene tetrahydromethanopterin reductase-like flavin-dependent oxidoreductase (luciferase family)